MSEQKKIEILSLNVKKLINLHILWNALNEINILIP